MDVLITIVRFPIGVVIIPVVASFWLMMAPLEFVIGAIGLPFLVIFMSREEIKNSYGKWPYFSLNRITVDAGKIWSWIFVG